MLLKNAPGEFKFEPPAMKNGSIDWNSIKQQNSSGLIDNKGRVWKKDFGSVSQDNFHWDVQTYNNNSGKWMHTNVNSNGTINHGANNFNNF